MHTKDAALFRKERAAGVLEEIRECHEPQLTIFVSCSDGDRFPDKLRHHCRVTRTDRHPVISNPGGVLLLHPEHRVSRLFCRGGGDDLERLVYMLRKRTEQVHAPVGVVLCAHWPCIAAQDAGVTAHEVLQLLAETKAHVRARLRSECGTAPHVSARIQLDWTGKEQDMRTYQFKLRRWNSRHSAHVCHTQERLPAVVRIA